MKEPMDYQGIRHEGLTPGLELPVSGPKGEGVTWALWDQCLTPADDQGKTGTCAAQAMTRIMESMITFHSGQRPRLDPLKFYRAVWEDQEGRPWPGDGGYETGLKTYTAFTSGVKLGILPSDAVRIDAEPASPSLAYALAVSPLFAATCVTEGWRFPTTLGEIMDAEVTYSGHAWVIPGLRRGKDGQQMVCGANSWGMRWGWNGFHQMRLPQFVRCAWIKPFAVAADWGAWVKAGSWQGLIGG